MDAATYLAKITALQDIERFWPQPAESEGVEVHTLPGRRDAYPEGHDYYDEGCDVSPRCLTSPLPRCRYDGDGRDFQRVRMDSRRQRALNLRRIGLPAEAIAEQLGCSKRTAFSIDSWSPHGTTRAEPAEVPPAAATQLGTDMRYEERTMSEPDPYLPPPGWEPKSSFFKSIWAKAEFKQRNKRVALVCPHCGESMVLKVTLEGPGASQEGLTVV